MEIAIVGITELNSFNVICGIATLVALAGNMVQWLRNRDLKKSLRAKAQWLYNSFYRIAEFADVIRRCDGNDLAEMKLKNKERAGMINGYTGDARLNIVAFAGEHLNFVPKREVPWSPSNESLPELGKPGPRDED